MAYLLVYLVFLGFALRNIVNADCGCGPKCVIFTDDMKCARCCTMSVKRRSLSSVSISQEENILTEKVDQKMKQVNFSAIFKSFNVLHYFSNIYDFPYFSIDFCFRHIRKTTVFPCGCKKPLILGKITILLYFPEGATNEFIKDDIAFRTPRNTDSFPKC